MDRTEYTILEFLKQHPKEGYQVHEVADGIGEWNPPQGLGKQILYAIGIAASIGGSLDELVKERLVDKKKIDGIDWYCIRRQ